MWSLVLFSFCRLLGSVHGAPRYASEGIGWVDVAFTDNLPVVALIEVTRKSVAEDCVLEKCLLL